MDELAKNADFPNEKVSTLDGLRVDFEDGFGLIRPSNTTPVLVMRFEGETQTALDSIQDKFKSLIVKTREGLDLPF